MKPKNSMEAFLAAWTPRGPSASLESQVFGAAARPLRGTPSLIPRLEPASALMLLAFVTLRDGSDRPTFETAGTEDPREASAMNRGLVASDVGGYSQSHVNGFPHARFEWTTASRSPSSNASFVPLGTNTVRR